MDLWTIGGATAGRSPALQLLHGGAQVARRHHVHLAVDAVFGDQRVEGVGQHAEEQREGGATR